MTSEQMSERLVTAKVEAFVRKLGFSSVLECAKFEKCTLLKHVGCGQKTIAGIQRRLEANGLAFAERTPVPYVPLPIAPTPEGPRPWTRSGGVYFIRCGLFIKIGISDGVTYRLRNLQNIIPYPLEPLGFIQTLTAKEALRFEADLHEAFKTQRTTGEWFRDHSALRDYIAEHAAVWPSR